MYENFKVHFVDMSNMDLKEYLINLCNERNESWREASMRAGLNPTAISKYIAGTRPSISSCLRLADHFAVDPNKMLHLAGHPPLENLPAWREGREMQLEEIKERLAIFTDVVRREVEELHPDYFKDMILVPLIGTVPGGHLDFCEEEEEAEEFYPIRRAIIHPDGAYCLTVTGNSMVGRGIIDGDIVFVDKILEPKDGSIVIARRGDEAVIRVYRKDDDGRPYLEAANKGYPRLRLRDVEIMGVVVESRREHR